MILKEFDGQLKQSEDRQSSPSTPSIWRGAILPYLSTRLCLVLIGLLTDFYILPLLKSSPVLPSPPANTHFPDTLWLMWQRFDSGFYLNLAKSGYWSASTLHTYSNWAFFPLFPLLIFLLAHLFGGSETAFSLAGLFVSNAAALIAVTYLYKLAQREFGANIASLSVIYLALFPTSFYLSVIYTESLFLACSVACIYYARKQRWWLSGLCGGLASLTRAQGVLLLIPVAWEYWQVLSDRYDPLASTGEFHLQERIRAWFTSRLRGPLLASRELRNWLSLLALGLIPSGLLAFMIYGKIKTGHLLATFDNQKWGWGRSFENPLQLLSTSLTNPQRANPMDWNFWILNVCFALLFLGFTVWAFRKLPMIYALFTLVMVLLPLSSSRLNSISRYYLLVFPVFILLALWSKNVEHANRRFLIMTLFAMLQAVLMVFFVLGIPAIA
jgi:Dolichyl-phosphate-mannose-protein mannosyltransferase